jgi:tetratricopeptide (TPR) repeat protein
MQCHPKIRRLAFTLIVLCIVPLSVSTATAQSGGGGGVDLTGTGGRHTIQGRIYFPSGRRSDTRLKVKLTSFNAGELSVFSDPNGSFIFRSLEPGSYTVVIEGDENYEAAREVVYIETDGTKSLRGVILPPVSKIYTVDISLQPKRGVSARAGVVSAVLAAVPQNARALYFKALESGLAHENLKAIEQLKSALAIYPQFPLALNELGVQYLTIGKLNEAAEALKAAVNLAPEDFQPRLNYGITLLNQRRFPEAEEQLRAAVAKNNEAPTAHMYLGITLAMQRKLDEGQKELQLAIGSKSNEVFLSHRYLAGIYLERHQKVRAAEELEAYLQHFPKAPDAEILQRKIKELRAAK